MAGFTICSLNVNQEKYFSECRSIEDDADHVIGTKIRKNAELNSCGCCDVTLEDGGVWPDFCDAVPEMAVRR